MVNNREDITVLNARLTQSDKLLINLSNSIRGPLYSIMELARIALGDSSSSNQTSDYLALIEIRPYYKRIHR